MLTEANQRKELAANKLEAMKQEMAKLEHLHRSLATDAASVQAMFSRTNGDINAAQAKAEELRELCYKQVRVVLFTSEKSEGAKPIALL